MMRRDIELYEIDMPTLERDKETGRMKLIVPKSVLMDFFVKANINYGDKIINRLLTLTIADFVVKNTEKRGIVNLIELPYPVDYSSLFENLLNTDA